MKLKATILALLFAAGASAPAAAGVLRKNEMDEVICASQKMQLFYYYITNPTGENIKKHVMECRGNKITYVIPGWFTDALPGMTARKVWRDPEQGEISEAGMWQTTVSLLYEYFELTRKTFPAEQGGANIAPGLLVKEYADIRIRYQMSLDRLYRARLGDSMGGRGRTMMAQLNIILRQMESIADAISSTNSKRYAEAVTGSAVLAQDMFSQLLKSPRTYAKPPEPSRLQQLVFTVATIIGIFLVFLAVRLFFSLNESRTEQMVADYTKKAGKWTEDFSRQFMAVKVHYLVLGPAVLGALAGLMTFSLLGFLFMTLAGGYIGFKMPGLVLASMKASRGRKIDGQLMDALILLSNCLKSGLDVVQGFEMVSKDLLPPISDEFGLVIKNYQLGMTFEKALGVMEERVTSKMLSYVIRAIVLQRQMGGNLTKVFERIVIDIREESKLEEKTKAMTAQQRIQSIVVGIMPWIMVGVMFLFQGEVMSRFYFSPLGMMVLLFCAIWIGIGMKIVSSLGKIRV